MDFYKVAEIVCKHEGFVGTPYIDYLRRKYPERYGLTHRIVSIVESVLPKLKLTFGHGLTYITEDESKEVVKMRLVDIDESLRRHIVFYDDLHDKAKYALLSMAYQLGVEGVLKFKKMLIALQKKDYDKARVEALDSKWAKQTPNRAREVSSLFIIKDFRNA